MELGREPDRQWLVTAARPLLFVDMALELIDLRTCQISGEPLHHQPLHRDADVEDVTRLVPARGRNRSATIAAKLDQSLRRQLAERMAHDGAAGAEPFADRVFRQLGARLQGLLDDRAAQRTINGADAIGIGGLFRLALFGHGRSPAVFDCVP